MESQSDYSTRGCLLGKTVSPRLQQLEDDFMDNGGCFKEFRIGDLFDIHSSMKKFNANSVKFGGKYPYVARGSSNNGIKGYITENPVYLNKGNTISIGQDTGTVYYQQEPYFTGDKIKIAELKGHKLTEKIAIYFIVSIRKKFSEFKWGQNSFNESILLDLPLLLPVNTKFEIDFDYMESYIRELEQERIRELDAYLKATGLNDYELTPKEKNSIEIMQNGGGKYKEFIIGDLFESFAGDVDLQNRDLTNTGEYFINSGVMNQGIKGRTTRKARIFNEGSLTIDFFGNCFYRDFKYKLATHNHVFSLQSDILKNQEISLYIAATFYYMKKCHSFNEMLTQTILKNYSIVLPVKDNDEIDYEFMDFFIKAVEKICIKSVVDWKDRIIQTTKNVVNC